jgi:talin
VEYRRKMRLLKVKMLDNSVKSIMADDSQVVSNLMVLICQKIGITSHDEYSLIWDKPEDESEKPGKENKYGTLNSRTLTLRGKKGADTDEVVDPKMIEMRQALQTEDGGIFFELAHFFISKNFSYTFVMLMIL